MFRDIGGADEWHAFIDQAAQAVRGVPAWEVAVPAALTAMRPEAGARLQAVVRHGCDFVTCLAIGRPSGAFHHFRSLVVEVGGVRLSGNVEWDDPGHALDVAGLVASVYPDPEAWTAAAHAGQLRQTDAVLLNSLGITDGLFWIDADAAETVASGPDGALIRRPAEFRGNSSHPSTPGRSHVFHFKRAYRDALWHVSEAFGPAVRTFWATP
ncbi:hypothetical protein [Nocardiopsis coralliicola]